MKLKSLIAIATLLLCAQGAVAQPKARLKAQAEADKLIQNAEYLRQKRINEAVQQVAEEMIEAYRNALGIETDYLITRPGEGARVLYQA